MSVSPPYLSPGVDAWADGAADVDGAPSAEQLAAWFAHPSAGLDDMPWTKDARCVDVAPGAEDARCVEVVPQDAYSRGVDCEAGGATVADPNADAVPGWVELEWLAAPIRPEVRALMRLAPGPALLTALASLPAGPCPADHSDLAFGVRPLPGSTPGFACACQLVVAAGWDSMATWTGTSAAVHLVDIAGRDLVTVLPEGAPVAARSVDPIRTDLAPMLHLSTDSTGTRLAQGRAITEHPALAQLCVAGVISAAASRAILAETSHLSVEATATVVTAVVAKVKARRDSGAAGWTATELGQVTKRAVRALAADELEQARADAYADRRATVTPAGHGMAWLSFLIRDVDALRIYNRLTAQAQAAKADAKERDSGDGRTADQLRADIAAATLLGQGFSPADNSASADKSDDEAGADVAACED
ncbi:MAG: hypothetical protein QG597_1980, partial [Actinomycetota bacterium]|nr:hypothetical protein [Actinomycetota bacterium]